MNRRNLIIGATGLVVAAAVSTPAQAEALVPGIDRYNWPKGRTVYDTDYEHNNNEPWWNASIHDPASYFEAIGLRP